MIELKNGTYAKQSKHKIMLDITRLNILSFIYSGFIYKINKKCYMYCRKDQYFLNILEIHVHVLQKVTMF